ncbi:hypothetical protein [Salisaeta longa]|uniref:hypothetical protein n=1 Tax=Salisaeta longa TaxID=503170 RepID=UPI0003B50692|nr:hypothetical protein [Salisaeta longa]
MPSAPLTQFVDDVYALACTVRAPDAAEAATRAIYEALCDEHEPATANRSMLFTYAVRTLAASEDAPTDASWSAPEQAPEAPTDAASPPQTFSDRALADWLHTVVPLALAHCMPMQRLRIAHAALQRSATAPPDAVTTPLRRALRAVTPQGTHALLHSVADDRLYAVVRSVLEDYYHPAPSTLRASVASLVASAGTNAAAEASPTNSDASTSPPSSTSALAFVPWRRLIAAVTALLVIGGSAWALMSFLEPAPAPTPDLLQLSVRRSETVRPVAPQPSPEAAAAYIRTTFGRRVSMPRIDGTRLTGVGTLRLGSTPVPAFVLNDTTTTMRLVVYAYSYALFDALADRASVPREVRVVLEDSSAVFTRRYTDRGALAWRVRDDIFVAVTPGPPARWRDRIRP